MVDTDSYVSIVAPLFNDADIVEAFISEALDVLSDHYANYELVLVDDGSSDDTVKRVESSLTSRQRVRLIRLSRRFGQETAISAALDTVIGDFTVVMLPDSDPPTRVPQMIEQCRSGAEIVFGIRNDRAADPWHLRAGSKLFYYFCNRFLKLNIPENSTHFRAMSRTVVNALTQIRDRGRYLHMLSEYVGYRNQSFHYDLIERRPKRRTKSLAEAIELAINIIVSNSSRPLRLISWVGFAAAVLNALYIGYIVIVFLIKDDVAEGWATQSLQNTGMFLFLFLILAVLCEYVGRILDEAKGRPLYYVMEEKNSSVLLLDEKQKNVVTRSGEDP
jgi:dolichol-phosphate mannosyltransferase